MNERLKSILEIKKSLQIIESEGEKLKRLTEDIPGVQKNITPIMAFIDILKFHIGELKEEE